MDTAIKNPKPLELLLTHRELILVTGKGGVGKSTVAAAIAILAARIRGQATAVETSAHPRLPELLAGQPDVKALNVVVENALPAVLGRLMRLPQLLSSLLTNRVIKLFLKTAPAVSELVLLDEVAQLVNSHSGDRGPVVVDLPATGHALSLLGTPRTVHRMLKVGPVARLAKQLEQLILDPQRSELVVVALPEELPINETLELLRRSEEIGVACSTVLVNQVPRAPVETENREWLEHIEQGPENTLSDMARAASAEMKAVDEAQRQIQRLRESTNATVIELPRSDADDTGVQMQSILAVLGA